MIFNKTLWERLYNLVLYYEDCVIVLSYVRKFMQLQLFSLSALSVQTYSGRVAFK